MLYKALFTRQFSMHDTAGHVMTSVNRPERSSGSTTVAVIREGQTTFLLLGIFIVTSKVLSQGETRK